MIPEEYDTPYLSSLREKLMKDEEQVFKYPGPKPKDLQLLAGFIHSYNYIELNARRCVEMFALAKMLNPEPKGGYKNVHPSKLIPAIQEIVKGMPPSVENVDNTLRGLLQIEVARGHRNMFAHFAVRRLPDVEALVFVCKDNKDFIRVHGFEIPELGVLFSIMEIKHIKELAAVVHDCEDWFAHKTVDWMKRYPKNA